METLDASSALKRSPQHYLKDALKLAKSHQLSAALQTMDAAIVFSHNSPFYIYQKIRLLYQTGALQSCGEFIVSQLEHLYKQGSLYILCRCIDYLQKATPYSVNDLRTILHEHNVPYCLADSYSTWLVQRNKPFFELAEKALTQDYYDLCLGYCSLYLKVNKPTTKLYHMQGYCHHMLGHLLLAKNYYQESLNLQPDYADTYLHIGLISMELGDYTTALESLQKACNLKPDHPVYTLYLGECYYAAKKYREAASTYESMIYKQPGNLQNYFNLSHTYIKMSKNRLSKRYTKRVRKMLKRV